MDDSSSRVVSALGVCGAPPRVPSSVEEGNWKSSGGVTATMMNALWAAFVLALIPAATTARCIKQTVACNPGLRVADDMLRTSKGVDILWWVHFAVVCVMRTARHYDGQRSRVVQLGMCGGDFIRKYVAR